MTITSATSGVPAVSDEVEGALSQAMDLIETAVAEHRSRTSRLVVEARPDEETLRQAAADLRTRPPLACVLPPGRDPLAFVVAMLATPPEGGVPLRLLAAPDAMAGAIGGPLLRPGAPVDVRVTAIPWQAVLITSDRLAVIRSPAGADGQTLLVRAPAILAALHALFASTWRSAAPLADHRRVSDRMREQSTQRILGALCAGHTDDVAARELGMSLRTYRRRVAEILRDLGADSRFQAGALAADLGLLPTQHPSQPGVSVPTRRAL